MDNKGDRLLFFSCPPFFYPLFLFFTQAEYNLPDSCLLLPASCGWLNNSELIYGQGHLPAPEKSQDSSARTSRSLHKWLHLRLLSFCFFLPVLLNLWLCAYWLYWWEISGFCTQTISFYIIIRNRLDLFEQLR